MMNIFHFATGEWRQISFLANTAETMPSQESPETSQAEKINVPDTTHEKDAEHTKAMEEMELRIKKGDEARGTEVRSLQSMENFRKSLRGSASVENDIDESISTASNDAGDAAQESADLILTAGLDDITPEIGKKLRPNEVPEIKHTEAAGNEARPAARTTEAEGVRRDQEKAGQTTDQTNAPSENPDGSKTR